MEIVLTKMYPSNVSIINIYQTIITTKSTRFFMDFFQHSNTSDDTLVVKTKLDINIFFTPRLRHLSTMYLLLLKRSSVFDWLLSFKTSFILAWIRTASGMYIFKFTSRYCNNCFDVVPGNVRCFATHF